MKLFIRHLTAFGLMFIVVFVAFAGIFLVFPLIMAFLAWDISFITFDWESVFGFIRINVFLSSIMGLFFTFSKEGKEYAKGEE